MNDWKKELRKYLSSQKWAKISPAQLELSSFQMNSDTTHALAKEKSSSLMSCTYFAMLTYLFKQ